MASANALSGGLDDNSVPDAHQNGHRLTRESSWAKQNVLTFDGGGVRGYYSLLHLQYLMQCIQQAEDDWNANNAPDYDDNLSSFSPCQEPKDFSHCTKSESRFLPCHYFDYISGTSTGALITIMLTTLRMSVNDCLLEYKRLAGQVFGCPRPVHHAGVFGAIPFVTKNKYATTDLENAIKDVIRRRGEATHNHDGAMLFRTPKGLCRAIVFAKRSVESGAFKHPWTFRSYDNFSARPEKTTSPAKALNLNPGLGTNLAAWKVARAATAAPLYFKPLEITLDDGEVIRAKRKSTTNLSSKAKTGSNRQLDATEEREQAKPTSNTALLSDAGFSKINNPSVNVLHELNQVFRQGPKKVENWVSIGTARQISPHRTSTLLGLLKDATSEIGNPEEEHQRMEQFHSGGFNYYRLNEPGALSHVDMDDWKPRRSKGSGVDTIQAMEDAFGTWIRVRSNQKAVEKAAERLVKIRRDRTKEFSRWERFALGRLFVCPDDDCYLESDETWHYRDAFAHHLVTDHGYKGPDDIEKAIKNSHRDWEYKPRDR